MSKIHEPLHTQFGVFNATHMLSKLQACRNFCLTAYCSNYPMPDAPHRSYCVDQSDVADATYKSHHLPSRRLPKVLTQHRIYAVAEHLAAPKPESSDHELLATPSSGYIRS